MGGEVTDSAKGGASSKSVTAADPLYDEEVSEEEQFVAIPPLSNSPLTAVKPENLKLLHRIGLGAFGDVWLANIHSHRDDFDEYHEVAVKVLPMPSLSEDQVRSLSGKLEEIISVSQGSSSVSWPRGISMKNGKACVITKLYEMSIGDKMARLPGNSIPLADALRYGVNIAQGVIDLHSRGLMALNLKPFNLLLDEQDQAVLGEFGIPFLLMGAVSADGPVVWLGTPNYMAPEQWDPKLRGPISFESDSWGFACTFIEMLTGIKPWSSLSPSEIFSAVVVRGETPVVPSGLPGPLHRLLSGCLSYDRRGRPSFSEILAVLRSPSQVFKESDWIVVADKSFKRGSRVGVVKKVRGPESVQVVFCDKPEEPVEYTGLAKCSLWKEELHAGDVVRLKPGVSSARFGWTEQLESEGTVTGIDKDTGVMLVRFPGSGETFKADPSEVQLSASLISAGDWVRIRDGWSSGDGGRAPSTTGVVQKVLSGGVVQAAFLGRETLWEGPASHLVKAPELRVGEFVRVKKEVTEPRLEWLVKRGKEQQLVWETGRISRVLANGCLEVDFPGRGFFGRKSCWADADEVEIVRLSECPSLGDKFSHLQAMHWAIGPAICLLGFLAAVRVGGVVGGLVIRPLARGGSKRKPESGGAGAGAGASGAAATLSPAELRVDPGAKGSAGGGNNSPWLPPAVASILFKEGQATSS